MEPLVLESTAYNIGYAIGQMIGVLILLAIPSGIGYGIYRLIKSGSKPPPSVQYSGPTHAKTDNTGTTVCPACNGTVPAGRRFCMNCGKEMARGTP